MSGIGHDARGLVLFPPGVIHKEHGISYKKLGRAFIDGTKGRVAVFKLTGSWPVYQSALPILDDHPPKDDCSAPTWRVDLADRDDEILSELKRLHRRLDTINQHIDILSGRQMKMNLTSESIAGQLRTLVNMLVDDVEEFDVEIDRGEPGEADIIHFPRV
jgi:hypothetical protein